MSENVDVVVLGAGISGLCLAHRLAQAGRKVLVLESAAKPGGCVCSEAQPAGFWFEMGAHTLYNSYGSLLSIIDELGLRDRMLTRRRAPFRMLVEGKLRSIPSQLSLTELFALAWHALRERKQGQTVAEYYGKLVGRQNWNRVFAPLFATVLSQPADNFPAEILFKQRPRRKDIPRSFTFAGGIQTLTDRITAEPGITLRTDATARALARKDGGFVVEIAGGDQVVARRLALALPAPEAAGLLAPLTPEIATALARIHVAKIESVGVVAESRHLRLPRLAGIVPVNDSFFSVVTRDVVPDQNLRAFTFHFRAGLTLDEAHRPHLRRHRPGPRRDRPRRHPRHVFAIAVAGTRRNCGEDRPPVCPEVASSLRATTSAAWPSKTARCARPGKLLGSWTELRVKLPQTAWVRARRPSGSAAQAVSLRAQQTMRPRRVVGCNLVQVAGQAQDWAHAGTRRPGAGSQAQSASADEARPSSCFREGSFHVEALRLLLSVGGDDYPESPI